MLNADRIISEKHDTTNDQQTVVSGFPITAIVVEHETITRGLLAALLSCDGYRVFQADNPITAMSYFRTNNPDVLFVDLDLPEWALIVQHALESEPSIFVIGMIENNATPDVSDLKQYGIGVCLQKPILYNDLRRTLSEYSLERRSKLQNGAVKAELERLKRELKKMPERWDFVQR